MKRVMIFLALAALMVTGCGVNWEEVHKAQERESSNLETWIQAFKPTLAPPPESAGDIVQAAYQVRMAGAGEVLRKMRPNTLETVLTYAYRHDQQLYQWLNLALNNPVTGAATREVFGDGGSSRPGIQIGDKGSSFNNMQFDIANDGSVIAKDEAVAANRKGAVADDGAMAASDDGQNQLGDGTQGQAISRPFNQPQPETEGGAINNDSEGLGFEGSL